MVSSLRERYSADLIAAVGNYEGWCGIAFAPSSEMQFNPGTGVSLTNSRPDFGCLQNVTMAHEIGHNLGLHHDPANAGDPSELIRPYAYGHFVDMEFRTIMSYWNQCTDGNSWNCPSVDHFSDPDIIPAGEASPSGIEDERHNSRVIDTTDAWVADYLEPEYELDAVFNVDGEISPAGDAIWRARDENGEGVAAYSGALAGGESSHVDLVLEGGNQYGFEWKLSSEPEERSLRVVHDGEVLFDSEGKATGEWESAGFDLDVEGEATVRFVFEAASDVAFEDREVAVRQFEANQVALAGQVENVHGRAIGDVQITAFGPDDEEIRSTMSNESGEFTLRVPEDLLEEHDDLALEFSGAGVMEKSGLANDCLEEEGGCTVTVEGESRLISGYLTGMLADENAGLVLATTDEPTDEQSVDVSSDANGEAEFSFEVDALLEYDAILVDARGYSEAASDVIGNSAREADIDDLEISLNPNAPQLMAVGLASTSRDQIDIDVALDTGDRDVTIIVDYGLFDDEDNGLDEQVQLEVSGSDAGEETVTVSLTGLDCASEYSWETRVVNDHDQSDEMAAMSTDTDACPVDDGGGSSGCTLSPDQSGRPDPVFWGLVLLALFWGGQRRWRSSQ